MSKGDYIVVFRYTKMAGGYEGVITFTPFESKEAFDLHFAKLNGTIIEGKKIICEEEVIEEGCTMERASELVATVGLRTYARAAIEESTGPNGSVNLEAARMRFTGALILFGMGDITRI